MLKRNINAISLTQARQNNFFKISNPQGIEDIHGAFMKYIFKTDGLSQRVHFFSQEQNIPFTYV